MKIYPSIRNILITRLLPILLCFFMFGVSFILFSELKDKSIAWIAYLVVSVSTIGLIWIFYSLYKALLKCKNEILELTEEGFCYPYLLASNPLIYWSDVLSIDMLFIPTYRAPDIPFIIIELKAGVELGQLGTFDRFINQRLSKEKQKNLIVISHKIMGGYPLKEIHDLLRWRWRKSVDINSQKNSIKRHVILYDQCFNFWIHGGCYLGMTIAFYLASVFTISVLHKPQPSFAFLTSASLIASIFFYLFFEENHWISKFSAKKLKPVAVDLDRDSIYLLNKTKFAQPLLWERITSIEVTTQRKGQYFKPYLTIKLENALGEIQNFQIRNELLNTSIYELHEVLTKYWLAR